MNPPYTCTIDEGIRNLLLGRVLLKRDLAAGDTVIPLGDEFTGALAGCVVPGANLFYNYATQAVLVQPAAANKPGAVEYQEEVALIEGLPNATHAVAASPVGHSYTRERGAYLRLKDLPEACRGLKLTETDILDVVTPPQDHLFPGALVISSQVNAEDWSNAEEMYHYQVVIRYARLMEGPDSRRFLQRDLEQLAFLLAQDRYLGGTATDSQITRPFVMNPTPGRVPNAYEQAASGTRLDWGDIYLTAHRLVVIDKSIK